MRRTKSRDPLDRVGIYKRIEEVPEQHRLAQYQRQYRSRDVWAEFCVEHEYQQSDSTRFREGVDRSGKHWKEHMISECRHHALATPLHVERWCQKLLADKSPATAYNYWVRIKRFYEWLLWHTDHPHRYSPVLIAVLSGTASRVVWDVKLDKWDRARDQYEPVEKSK